MRLISLLLIALLFNPVFCAEPAVISFPQENQLVTTVSEFDVISAGVNASVGMRVVGQATGLTITVKGGILDLYDITLIHDDVPQSINYTLFRGSDYYMFKPSVELVNGDEVIIDFKAILGFGTHDIIVEFDSAESSHTIESGVRIEQGFKPLVVNQSDWIQGSALIGRPVPWISIVDVFNINEFGHESLVNVSLLPDSSNIRVNDQLIDFSINGLNAYWRASLVSQESKRYAVTAQTPPVIKESQTISLLETSGDDYLIRTNLTFVNLALIDYSDVSYDFNIRFNNIVNVSCNQCNWFEINDFLRVSFPLINDSSQVNLVIDYWDKPPLFTLLPNARGFDQDSVIKLDLFLVPNQLIEGFNLELEVLAPNGELVFADLLSFDGLSPTDVFNHSLNFSINNAPSGNYTINANSRVGLEVIALASEWFVVSPSESLVDELALILTVIIIFLIIVRLRFHN